MRLSVPGGRGIYKEKHNITKTRDDRLDKIVQAIYLDILIINTKKYKPKKKKKKETYVIKRMNE